MKNLLQLWFTYSSLNLSLEAKLRTTTYVLWVLERRVMQNLRSRMLGLWFQFSTLPVPLLLSIRAQCQTWVSSLLEAMRMNT